MTDANDFLYNNDAAQKEKMEVLRNERRLRDTFHTRAQVDPDEPGGRFAKLHPTSVTGSSPTSHVPPLPPSSPWHCDPVPKEEPLGYSVNAQEPIGSRAEQIEAEKLLAAREGAAANKPISQAASSIRRRI
jgi:hypothetical protein